MKQDVEFDQTSFGWGSERKLILFGGIDSDVDLDTKEKHDWAVKVTELFCKTLNDNKL